jgi:hypothetical protein
LCHAANARRDVRSLRDIAAVLRHTAEQVNALQFLGPGGTFSYHAKLLLPAVIAEALLELLPCPLPPGASSEIAAHDPTVWFNPPAVSDTDLRKEDPWRVGPCSLLEQREILRDLRAIVTAYFSVYRAFGSEPFCDDNGFLLSLELFPAETAVLAAVAACMADACLRWDPSSIPSIPESDSAFPSPLTEIINGTFSHGSRPDVSDNILRPFGFSLRTRDGLLPFTALLATNVVLNPRLIRARASAVRYEQGVSVVVGRGAPVPFTWAGCCHGIAINDPTFDVVDALVSMTWRRFERAPRYSPHAQGDDVEDCAEAEAEYVWALSDASPAVVRRHELAAWLAHDLSWEADLPELLCLRDLTLFLRVAAAGNWDNCPDNITNFKCALVQPTAPRFMVPFQASTQTWRNPPRNGSGSPPPPPLFLFCCFLSSLCSYCLNHRILNLFSSTTMAA